MRTAREFEFRPLDRDHPANSRLCRRRAPGRQVPGTDRRRRDRCRGNGDRRIPRRPSPRPRAADPGRAGDCRDGADARPRVRQLRDGQPAADSGGPLHRQGQSRRRRNARSHPDEAEIAAGKARLRQAYAWLERWLEGNLLPPHVCSSPAPPPRRCSTPIGSSASRKCPRLAALRAELLALPAVSRCVEDARPMRGYFPPGAPDRD